jgi:hypothetical protein
MNSKYVLLSINYVNFIYANEKMVYDYFSIDFVYHVWYKIFLFATFQHGSRQR